MANKKKGTPGDPEVSKPATKRKRSQKDDIAKPSPKKKRESTASTSKKADEKSDVSDYYDSDADVSMASFHNDIRGEIPKDLWPEQDLTELLRRIEKQIPENDHATYKCRIEHLVWEEVAFNEYTPLQCRQMFETITERVRKFRILREVLADGYDWIKKPWTHFYRSNKTENGITKIGATHSLDPSGDDIRFVGGINEVEARINTHTKQSSITQFLTAKKFGAQSEKDDNLNVFPIIVSTVSLATTDSNLNADLIDNNRNINLESADLNRTLFLNNMGLQRLNTMESAKKLVDEPPDPPSNEYEYFKCHFSGSIQEANEVWSGMRNATRMTYRKKYMEYLVENTKQYEVFLKSLSDELFTQYILENPIVIDDDDEDCLMNNDIVSSPKKSEKKKRIRKKKLSKTEERQQFITKALIKKCLEIYEIYLDSKTFEEFREYAILQELSNDAENTEVHYDDDDIDELKECYILKYKMFLKNLPYDALLIHGKEELESSVYNETISNPQK